ncbi:HemK family protein methyltransferase [Candidatus Gracilibacteria bacterium]|nr:HemK family protein methyltransferase [Candidatus Gracilibacteria bacterium]NUJ98705.1 HemK family protein methyltransferase [Candidatus Gracilibacteria bacterium]
MIEKYHIPPSSLEKIIIKYLGGNSKNLFLQEDISFIYEIEEDVKKLTHGYPLAYILGQAEFYGLSFFVDENTLIPRIDTEVLVRSVLDYCGEKKTKFFLFDIGTGTGCIPLSLNFYSPEFFKNTIGIDISANALKIAKKNKENLVKNKKISFLLLDFHYLESIIQEIDYKNKNLIFTANLPYIKNGDEALEKNVEVYEPQAALFGGKDTGFEMYEDLIKKLIVIKKEKKIKNIDLFIEIGYNQAECSKSFLEEKKLSYRQIFDTNKILRTLFIKI